MLTWKKMFLFYNIGKKLLYLIKILKAYDFNIYVLQKYYKRPILSSHT